MKNLLSFQTLNFWMSSSSTIFFPLLYSSLSIVDVDSVGDVDCLIVPPLPLHETLTAEERF